MDIYKFFLYRYNMNDPIKIIHKFKNDNNKIQYKTYIYIGSLVPDDILTILNSIIDKDLYTTLINLSKKNYNKLENYYGYFWYHKFFISYHIKNQLKLINTTQYKKKKIETQYGQEWYEKHINKSFDKKIMFSYSSMYNYNLLLNKKLKNIQTKDLDIDFRTYQLNNNELINRYSINNINTKYRYLNNNLIGGMPINDNLIGGMPINDNEDDDHIITEEIDDIDDYIDEYNEDNINEDNKIQYDNEDIEETIDNEFDLDEITNLYTTAEIDKTKNILETSKLISNAINNKKWTEEIKNLKEYDNSLDDIYYDSILENIYMKYYITNQYIFKDDTIKNIKDKICITIPISNKFGLNMQILPETQYLWSEYEYQNTSNKNILDAIMIGQKWIKKNELIKIDIIPNINLKVYENLKNNLNYLKDTFNIKIKREDEEYNILKSYDNYITMNEIFMLDIYNELGLKYNPNTIEKRNLYDVYVKIYFPLISYDRLDNIIQLLLKENEKELDYINIQYAKICNDLQLEYEIENIVEKTKMNSDKYDHLFSDNHIIHSIIHIDLINPKNITGTISSNKFNLYRIFDNFIVSKEYPFIQYQTQDSQITYKLYTKFNNINQDILSKWFENAPYGLTFKINTDLNEDTKIISITLYEIGRIEYKITWKESDNATIHDIQKTYTYIQNLLTKINS